VKLKLALYKGKMMLATEDDEFIEGITRIIVRDAVEEVTTVEVDLVLVDVPICIPEAFKKEG
jgi:hypothetical protein